MKCLQCRGVLITGVNSIWKHSIEGAFQCTYAKKMHDVVLAKCITLILICYLFQIGVNKVSCANFNLTRMICRYLFKVMLKCSVTMIDLYTARSCVNCFLFFFFFVLLLPLC